jgi:soluble lytic murein transglycosylase-like protein
LLQSAYRQQQPEGTGDDQGWTIRDYWNRTVPLQGAPHVGACRGPEDSDAATKHPPAKNAADVDAPTLRKDTDAPATQAAILRQIDNEIRRAARKYDLPAGLIRSVIRHESNFDPQAKSHAGALGLMQLMPATAREMGVGDPLDIEQNIDGGSRYLKKMLDQFDGDLRKALAAYNAGPGTVRRYGGVPPYRETRNYVRRVMSATAAVG